MKRCYDDIDQDEDDEVTHETNEWEQQWQPCSISSSTLLSSDQTFVTPSFGDQHSLSSDCPGHERTIVHIDLDCFYAQVEMIENPTLREKPLGIKQKNIVVTCNYIARERGVGKLSYVKDAVKICPDLVLVSGEDLSKYRQMSYKVTDYFLQFCPLVERLGFDENFIDVTKLVLARQESGKTYEVKGHTYSEELNKEVPSMACSCGCYQRLTIGSQIAYEMRTGLKQSLGLTSCAGIAHNKLLSKLVAGAHKPNQQTTLFPHEAHLLMLSLKNVKQIPGIGTSMSKRLAAMGIVAIQQLQETKLHILQQEFGNHLARTIHNLSHGIDPSPVVQTGPPQSLSDEDSFKKCSSIEDARKRTRELLTSLLKRLKEDGRVAHTLRIAVRKMSLQWTRESRQCPMPDNILQDGNLDDDVIEKVLDVAMHLFTKLVDTTQPFHLTLISVCFTKLEDRSKKPSITTYFKKAPEDPAKHQAKITTKLEKQKKPSIFTYFKDSSKQQCHKQAPDCSSNLSGTKTAFQKVGENSQKKQRIKSPFKNSGCYDNMQPQISNNRKLISELFSGERLSNNCSLDEAVSLKGNMQKAEKKAEHNKYTVERNGFQYSNSESMTTLQHQIEGRKQEKHVSAKNHLNSLELTSANVSLPSNVDRSVFIELPLLIQREIIENWERGKLMSKTKPKSKKSIKDFFTTK